MTAAFADVPLSAELEHLLETEDFKEEAGQEQLLYPHGAVAPCRLLLIGLGKRETPSQLMGLKN